MPLVGGGFDIEIGDALDAGFAFGKERDLSPILQSGMGQEGVFGGSGIERDVVGGGGDFLFTVLVVVFPAGDAGFEGIIFGDGRFHVVVAGDGFGDGDAVRTELQDAGGFGAASAIVELKENVEAVGGGPDGLLAGEIAHHEKGIALGGSG